MGSGFVSWLGFVAVRLGFYLRLGVYLTFLLSLSSPPHVDFNYCILGGVQEELLFKSVVKLLQ